VERQPLDFLRKSSGFIFMHKIISLFFIDTIKNLGTVVSKAPWNRKGRLMKYEPHGFAIFSIVDEIAPRAMQIPLFSNGIHVRDDRGRLMGKADLRQTLPFYALHLDKGYLGQIEDALLVERIITYWDEHLSQAETNCSSCAHYLTTGELVDCRLARRALVLRQGMRPLEMSSSIDVGDMVGLIYQDKRLSLSRGHEFNGRGRATQKLRRQRGSFSCTTAMRWRKKVYTPAEFMDMYDGLSADDYHFMVCVAKLNGEPVWLSQTMYHYPHEETDTFAITVGLIDPFLDEVPLAAFIKKAR
jgi:hypothetical protein